MTGLVSALPALKKPRLSCSYLDCALAAVACLFSKVYLFLLREALRVSIMPSGKFVWNIGFAKLNLSESAAYLRLSSSLALIPPYVMSSLYMNESRPSMILSTPQAGDHNSG